MFGKVLVANRGEIALRIFRTLRDMGLASVAVYSDVDRLAPHARYADEAYALGGNTSAESYLVTGKLLEAAARSGAEAVHPGYGFLPKCAFRTRRRGRRAHLDRPASGGDRADGIEDTRAAGDAGSRVPIIPGTTDPVGSAEEVVALGEQIGYPLIIKAAAGGGGKGMKIVRSADEALQASSRPNARTLVFRRRRCMSSAFWRTRGTSRCRCSPTPTAM